MAQRLTPALGTGSCVEATAAGLSSGMRIADDGDAALYTDDEPALAKDREVRLGFSCRTTGPEPRARRSYGYLTPLIENMRAVRARCDTSGVGWFIAATRWVR